jgi:hypothetical protein
VSVTGRSRAARSSGSCRRCRRLSTRCRFAGGAPSASSAFAAAFAAARRCRLRTGSWRELWPVVRRRRWRCTHTHQCTLAHSGHRTNCQAAAAAAGGSGGGGSGSGELTDSAPAAGWRPRPLHTLSQPARPRPPRSLPRARWQSSAPAASPGGQPSAAAPSPSKQQRRRPPKSDQAIIILYLAHTL